MPQDVWNWKQDLVEELNLIGDLDRQRRIWLEAAPPELPSPVELICGTIDDTDLDRRLEAGTVFSQEVYSMLKLTSALAAEIHTNQSLEQLLADPAWIRLAQLAKQVAGQITKGTAE
jgi:hypothetical protein